MQVWFYYQNEQNEGVLRRKIPFLFLVNHPNAQTKCTHRLHWFVLVDELFKNLKNVQKKQQMASSILISRNVQTRHKNVVVCKCHAEIWAHRWNWFVVITSWNMTDRVTFITSRDDRKIFLFHWQWSWISKCSKIGKTNLCTFVGYYYVWAFFFFFFFFLLTCESILTLFWTLSTFLFFLISREDYLCRLRDAALNLIVSDSPYILLERILWRVCVGGSQWIVEQTDVNRAMATSNKV